MQDIKSFSHKVCCTQSLEDSATRGLVDRISSLFTPIASKPFWFFGPNSEVWLLPIVLRFTSSLFKFIVPSKTNSQAQFGLVSSPTPATIAWRKEVILQGCGHSRGAVSLRSVAAIPLGNHDERTIQYIWPTLLWRCICISEHKCHAVHSGCSQFCSSNLFFFNLSRQLIYSFIIHHI
jgi:hypothetical protein